MQNSKTNGEINHQIGVILDTKFKILKLMVQLNKRIKLKLTYFPIICNLTFFLKINDKVVIL